MPSKPSKITLAAVALCCLFAASLHAGQERKLDPLPQPLSNNAVAAAYNDYGTKIFSFMGIGPGKASAAITTSAYEMDLNSGKWDEKRPVPGVVGRLAASAVALGGQVFIFGGYALDEKGGETTFSDLNVFVPFENRYYSGKDIPVPVDDALAAAYADRYIFLIGGWSGGRSNDQAVPNVQIYDTAKNAWAQATPNHGTPVFGHAGAILGNTIVYVDGAYKNPDSNGPKYLASSECWMGKIPDPKKGDITKIEWTKLPPHPGDARFRIAAGAGPAGKKGGKIYFSGGTANPYNYAGVGYDGHTPEPSPVAFAFDTRTEKWETINENLPDPTMDQRALLVTHRGLLLVGGMDKGQKVTANVTIVKEGSKK